MGRLFCTISLFFIGLLLFSAVSVEAKNNSFVLVIDPGHGGKDAGAVGRKGKEKTVNLEVAKYLGEYIKKEHPDVKIIYTRNTDKFIGLKERADIANKNQANLFISIHANAAESRKARGPEVFTFGMSKNKQNLEIAKRENAVISYEENFEEKYQEYNQESAEALMMFEFMQNLYAEQSINFAELVQKELKSCVKWQDRGVKQAAYLVLWQATMPRVLVELDFISNLEAENILISTKGQKRYAKAIADAFTEYKKDFDRKNTTIKQIATSDVVDNTVEEINKETNQLKIYKVQILSSSTELPSNAKQLKGYKAECYKENGMYKYTCGESTDFNEISNLKKTLSKDFKDAFIVCFQNGERITFKLN
ncbi:N-acetylmuramoyl-L-alanine amidase [Dysgonomonadaceae bacterium PH5-43]|nr:N-acetylmuramoyl-L-alanine amidase [Dysgonomonadaceae bacterium PH5-43]